MSLEKPISTIRKAIEGKAEKKAEDEFLTKPVQRHYSEVINSYKMVRGFEPESLERIISIDAKDKELKDEMGEELFKIFNLVLDDVTEKSEGVLKKAIDQILSRAKKEESSQEIIQLYERFFNSRADIFKTDPRIIDAFKGKEELLNKGLENAKTALLWLVESHLEKPILKSMTLQGVAEAMARMKRAYPTANELKEKQIKKQELKPQTLLAKILKLLRSIN